MKTCKGCQESLPEDQFSPAKSQCKACRSAVESARQRAKTAAKRASEHDYGKRDVPDGFHLKGVSQFVDAQGNVKAQWIKSEKDKEQRTRETIETLQRMFDETARKGYKLPRIKAPKGKRREDLKGIIPIGDGHFGLLTWDGEVEESYDLTIAQALYREALGACIEASAARGCETMLIAALGDFVHGDGPKNTTTKGTPVSIDGRWPKILFAAINTLEWAIQRALETHKFVDVSIIAGNHDEVATVSIVIALAKLFENNPRVRVNTDFGRFHYYRFGQCLIGTTHGDMAKPQDLPMIMASDRPIDWGATTYRHWLTGHVHHDRTKDYGPVTVETMRVLVPQDGWHHGQGYRSARDIKCDIWHKEFGLDQRNVMGIRKLRSLLK